MNARALFIAIMAFTFLTKLFGGSREQSGVDLATPKRAVQSLEDGWRANDIEKAGGAKIFAAKQSKFSATSPQTFAPRTSSRRQRRC